MDALRTWIFGNRFALIALCVLAFSIKAVIPTGYMISPSDGPLMLTVTVCDVSSPGLAKVEMAVPMKAGHRGHQSDQSIKHSDCAFTSLIGGALAGADPIQIEALLAFTLALAFLPLGALVVRQAAYLRPQTRAPPAQS